MKWSHAQNGWSCVDNDTNILCCLAIGMLSDTCSSSFIARDKIILEGEIHIKILSAQRAERFMQHRSN